MFSDYMWGAVNTNDDYKNYQFSFVLLIIF